MSKFVMRTLPKMGNRVNAKMSFDLVGLVEAQMHSGGIWVLKNKSAPFSMDAIDIFPQMVTFKCYQGNHSWVGNAIYASPIPSRKEALWCHTRELNSTINSPWILMGDFNEVSRASEVRGG
ncbi:Endonuclease/exonuclease/phosphatase superfamily [Sesbania bispinosa]|nr:Endonuclease/exonuclease/phosphatase superfamily [Sesbania bispinosa]